MGEQETSRAPLWGHCDDSTVRDRGNLRRVLAAVLAWAVTFAAASQLIKRGMLPDGGISWAAALIPSVVGIFVLLAYGRFLRGADELQRVIHLQALALGFGGTWLVASGYQILQRLGAPSADAGDLVLVMMLLYVVGTIVGRRRYR